MGVPNEGGGDESSEGDACQMEEEALSVLSEELFGTVLVIKASQYELDGTGEESGISAKTETSFCFRTHDGIPPGRSAKSMHPTF